VKPGANQGPTPQPRTPVARQANPGGKQMQPNRAGPRSPPPSTQSFLKAVQQEAKRYTKPDETVAAEDGQEADQDAVRAALQEQLKVAEAAFAALEALGEDPDLAPLLDIKKAKRDSIREQLHAARPIRSQLRSAEEARDKACRKHSQLSEEIHSMKLILQGKMAELEAIAADVSRHLAAVRRIQEQLVKEDPQQMSPVSQRSSSPTTPVQWAAGLAHVLPGAVKKSFHHWLSNQSLDPVPAAAPLVYNIDADDDREMMSVLEEEKQEDEANEFGDPHLDMDFQQALMASKVESEMHSTAAPPPFRRRTARADPYGTPPSRQQATRRPPSEDGNASVAGSGLGAAEGVDGAALAAP